MNSNQLSVINEQLSVPELRVPKQINRRIRNTPEENKLLVSGLRFAPTALRWN
jgi:hypothetical protein